MFVKSGHSIRLYAALLLAGSVWLSAGNTGKIAGTVVNKVTGEPLIGANVIIVGLELGGATDMNGAYYILQIPPGKYDVRVTYLGYHDLLITNVKVQVDLTTRVLFELDLQAIDLPTVVIVAEEALVRPDITSTRSSVSREEISRIPGFEQTTDMFLLQGGSTIDAAPQSLQIDAGTKLQIRDESVKNIHVRGGRGGEILYMVDGMPVTHPIYGGRDVLDINVVDIESIELLTGAFNAEYGQAQSGVVNITTRSGGASYKGGLEYKTDDFELFGQSYSTQYMSLYLGGQEPLTAKLLPKIGVIFPGRINFFVSANSNVTDTPYDNGRDRDEITRFGVIFRENQDNKGNVSAKLDWRPTQRIRLTTSYHSSWKNWSSFDWVWINNANNTAIYARDNRNLNFKLLHTLSPSTFYNLSVGYLTVAFSGALNRDVDNDGIKEGKPADFWVFYKDGIAYDHETFKQEVTTDPDSFFSKIQPSQLDASEFIDSQSYENYWRNDNTKTLTLKGDITSQIHSDHLVKMGISFQNNEISYVDIQDGGVRLSDYGEFLYEGGAEVAKPPGPYPEFGQLRWVFDAKPMMGGMYLQDKFEREFLIINAGARIDWFVPGESVNDPAWKEAWETSTGLVADWPNLRYTVSPRFGISFPISTETALFFSYGHFSQLPELQFFYRDPYTGSFTGNPHLSYENTILYEFGFTHQIQTHWALDIKSYTKDISQQVGTTNIRSSLGLPVELYDNRGYARARGLELKLSKRHSNYTSGNVVYAVQWANGYSSSAFDDYVRSLNDFPNPIRERPLSWDIRHQVIFQATLAVGENQSPRLFGLRLPANWNMTLLSRFSTGNPYTPGTLDPVERQKIENSAFGSVVMTSDLKINKTMTLAGMKISLFADVFNLFDRKNVQMAYGFNTWTGSPYNYGDTIQDLDRLYDWFTSVRLRDPQQFAAARQVKIGLRLDL